MPSFLQFFWHLLIDLGGFFWHFLTILVILHFFLSARPEQLVSGAGVAAGGDAGGPSGTHKSQVFLHFRFFLSGYLSHFFLLHVSPSLSEHEGEGGGGDGGGAGQKLHVPLHLSKNVLVNEHLAISCPRPSSTRPRKRMGLCVHNCCLCNSASQKDGSVSPHGGDGEGGAGGGGAVLSAPTLLMSTQEATRYLRRRVPLNLGSAIFVWLKRLLA